MTLSARNPRIRRPCPFCGEAEHLRVHDAAISRPVVEGSDTRKEPDGSETMEEVDAVACDVCEAMAPVDVWNGSRRSSDFAVLRDFDDCGAVSSPADLSGEANLSDQVLA